MPHQDAPGAAIAGSPWFDVPPFFHPGGGRLNILAASLKRLMNKRMIAVVIMKARANGKNSELRRRYNFSSSRTIGQAGGRVPHRAALAVFTGDEPELLPWPALRRGKIDLLVSGGVPQVRSLRAFLGIVINQECRQAVFMAVLRSKITPQTPTFPPNFKIQEADPFTVRQWLKQILTGI